MDTDRTIPSIDKWLKEAKARSDSGGNGMYLVHNGTVRETAKAFARNGEQGTLPVTGMDFSYDEAKADAAIEETYKMPGIHYVRVWMNSGRLNAGDDIMYVLIGGDIRPRIVDALNFLVGKLKDECVIEKEIN